jgi:phosphatidylglycerol:prolipoprotein diacylglycerol transferase
LVTATAVAAAYARFARVPASRLCDAFAYSLPAGVVLLRVGCFLGGCCWGTVCDDGPFGVTFPKDSPAYLQQRSAGLLAPPAERSLPVHPVQLYEATGVVAVLGLLIAIDGHLRRAGTSFLLSVLGYAAVRFVCDCFRADTGALAWSLTTGQWSSLALAAACLVVWKRLGAIPEPETAAPSEGQNGQPSGSRFPT